METNQSAASQTNADAPQQKSRLRIGRLSADEISAFPGATPPPVKKVEPIFSYYIAFSVPVTAPLGTQVEAGQIHDFAHQLDQQAKAKCVGAVSSISAANGLFDIVLKLDAAEEQASHAAPAANAFTQLKDFLDSALSLQQAAAGRPATYKAKVNGTTIIEGRF